MIGLSRLEKPPRLSRRQEARSPLPLRDRNILKAREASHMYRLMVADYDSPSYFVATAAVKLGFFKQQGLDVEFIAEYGARHGPERLRDGSIHFFGGPGFRRDARLSGVERGEARRRTRAVLLLVHGPAEGHRYSTR
jgi:hypothetical protein